MKKLILCGCHFYHRIPTETLQTIDASCTAAGMVCEIVPDLCFWMAKAPEKLRKLAEYDAIGACQERVVQTFLEGAGSPTCFDLRTLSAEDFLAKFVPEVEITRFSEGSQVWEKRFSEKPSEWIPWFPVIDTQRCVNCRKCVDFCMFGVYAVDVSNRVKVVEPESCKTNCPACARMCPQNAILFPKSEEPPLNGSLAEVVKPSEETTLSLKERLRRRKTPRLFKEDDV